MVDKSNQQIQSTRRALEDYIYFNWLDHGSPLPNERELATELSVSEETLAETLHAAQAGGRVTQTAGVWSVSDPQQTHAQSFSFTTSAQGHTLRTELIEKSVRLPIADKDHPLFSVERRVHNALQIPRDLPFIVVRRLRLIDDHPGAFQHTYLNPTLFPPDVLSHHDFANESLIKIYKSHQLTLLRRDTRLAPRSATGYEINALRHYGPTLETRLVLDAEQRLWANTPDHDRPVVLEFMKAAYLDNWRYEIKNRPASGQA